MAIKLSRHAVSFPPLDQVNIMSCHVMLSLLKTVVSFYLKREDGAAIEWFKTGLSAGEKHWKSSEAHHWLPWDHWIVYQVWARLIWAQALPIVKLVDLHIVSHFWLEIFSVLQYAVDFGSISKEDLRESQSWRRSSLLTLAPITQCPSLCISGLF